MYTTDASSNCLQIYFKQYPLLILFTHHIHRDAELDQFYQLNFPASPATLSTSNVVAKMLKEATEMVARRQGFMLRSGGASGFVATVGIEAHLKPRAKKIEMDKGREVLELINTFLPIPTTIFTVDKLDQVNNMRHFLL